MKTVRSILVFCCILILLSAFIAPVLAVDGADTTVSTGSHSMDAAVAYLGDGKITDNVEASFLYEVNSDTLMYASNADAQIYPSSMVKIMTALLAVEKGNLEEMITVSEGALATVPYYAASADLQAGEQISLKNLLYCMMVGSANDAAAVIAEHIGGNQADFVKLMNQRATELGCTATQFVNCHGLHDDAQYSTVRDIARILRAAVKNEKFMPFYSEIKYYVPATNMSEERELSSGNYLMNTASLQIYFDQRVTGGRTGIADDGSRCLASSAEENGMHLICVVVGSESTFAEDGNTLTYGSFKETSAMFDAGFDGYRVAQILYNGQALRQLSVVNGCNDVVLSSTQSVYCILPEDANVASLRYEYSDRTNLQAPISAGEVVSTLQVWHGSSCVAQTELIAANHVSAIDTVTNDNPDSGTDASGGAARKVILVILFIIGFVAAGLFAVRGYHIWKVRRRKKRYSISRRRSR